MYILWSAIRSASCASAAALRNGVCLFASHGDCEPDLAVVGLRGPDDLDAVLCCRLHLPHLRRLRPYEARRLASYLHAAFQRAA